MYVLENENLKFKGVWAIIVMSGDDPLFFTEVKLDVNGQYKWAGSGSAEWAKSIYNYEYKDLIVGFLGVRSPSGKNYLIIRKENKDIFVEVYDYSTQEWFKKEYSFSELINLIKK